MFYNNAFIEWAIITAVKSSAASNEIFLLNNFALSCHIGMARIMTMAIVVNMVVPNMPKWLINLPVINSKINPTQIAQR
jgi:hypothetical protein